MQGICQEFNVAASRARRPRLTSVGFAPHMIKDKCAAIINDDQCGYTREQGMTSRPMTVDEMLAPGLYVTPSAVNLKFLSVAAAPSS
jgi:hypothetical protein